jgi:SNF2 family DNA or RNA helicase
MVNRVAVELKVEGEAVIVSGDGLASDRSIRLFFSSVLGATRSDSGWICPRRRYAISELIVRINNFLESRGFRVERLGIVDDAVQRDIERRRSYERARIAGNEFRKGNPVLSIDAVRQKLSEFGWDHDARRLFPHQEDGVLHGLSAVNTANFSVPGAGKTITALAIGTVHLANDNIDCILIVGPLSCFAHWEKESKAALNRNIRAKRIRGSASERQQLYSDVRRGDLILASYAGAAADRALIVELCKRLRVMLVVDESHRVKRFRGGLWAPALMEIARYARVKITLSGTPMPQSGRDLYSQLRVLWPSGELTGPADDFAARVDRDFSSVLSDVRPFVSRTPKEALGLQPYTIHRHVAEMVSTQDEIYALVEDQFRRNVQDAVTWRDKIDALRRAKPIRLLQAASNPNLLNRIDGYYRLPRFSIPNPTLLQRLADYRHSEEPAKSLKALEILHDIFGRPETGRKAVCWSNFVHNLDDFAEMVRNHFGIAVYQIDGRVPTGDQAADDVAGTPRLLDTDTREAIIEKFLGDPAPAVLVTNPASTSESVSLHSTCHNAVYLDRTYDGALFLQSIDRIHRLGLRPGQAVEIHLILASTSTGGRTIDNLVDAALAAKEGTMRQLLEGAELHPLATSDDPLQTAEGTDQDLDALLKYLLGEDVDARTSL